MRCPSCGHDNREDAQFCLKCGGRLAVACPSCRKELPPEAEFCDACGARLAEPAKPAAAPDPRAYTPQHLAEKILRDRATLEGERRTVTALFADAVGFTPLSERLDEEEVYDLMQGCLGRMMDAVHRYEGTITQFRGDGVMALFGAPIAHEDLARRCSVAARNSAADMRARVPPPSSARRRSDADARSGRPDRRKRAMARSRGVGM